jgi:hypothetical protein
MTTDLTVLVDDRAALVTNNDEGRRGRRSGPDDRQT